MHELVLRCGFLGAWLLVVGPVYQAILELRAEDLESDRIRSTMRELPQPDPISPWWLVVPPVWWWRRHQHREVFQRQLMARISDEDYEAFSSFLSKARGWMFVAAGGFLIAAKETWELVEGHEWPTYVFWGLLVLGLLATLVNTLASVRSDAREREQRTASRAESAG